MERSLVLALWDITRHHLSILRPSFTNINRLCAQAVSSITSGLRFPTQPHMDMSEFPTNLVPFPRMHFPMVSYSPFVSSENAIHRLLSTSEITKDVFSPTHQLLKVDTRKGKHMVASLIYNGIVSPQEANAAIAQVKPVLQWVDWMQTGFKVSISQKCPSYIPGGDLAPIERSVCMLSNHTAVGQAWASLNKKFNSLLKGKAFLHWYLNEGMEEGDFEICRNDIAQLEADYKNADSK